MELPAFFAGNGLFWIGVGVCILICKFCESKTEVLYTRNDDDRNSTYRLRRCTSCDRRFGTLEFMKPPKSNKSQIQSVIYNGSSSDISI